jgi:hypothetical protein
MQSAARASVTSDRIRSDMTKLLLKPIECLVRTGDQAATVDRLFASQHVKDLRLIVATALIAVLLIFVIGVLLSYNEMPRQLSGFPTRHANWSSLHLVFAVAGTFLPIFVPVLAVFGVILAWAYQVGSVRLGVVDLFACEISTLCRVTTIVDTVRRYVEKFDHGPPAKPAGTRAPNPPAHQFTSQENYFPVFEGNARDLQALEARVVINITAFYTYMKAVRDSLRALAEITPGPEEFRSPPDKAALDGPWHEAVRNVVYMLFLGLESARHAIEDLVEFEPEKAERSIVILISELKAYGFLRNQFDEQDMHYQRIMMREPEYRDVVQRLLRSVAAGMAKETAEAETELRRPPLAFGWEPAGRLLSEFQSRYRDATGTPA